MGQIHILRRSVLCRDIRRHKRLKQIPVGIRHEVLGEQGQCLGGDLTPQGRRKRQHSQYRLLGSRVALRHLFRQLVLLLVGQERHLTDLLEVQADGVIHQPLLLQNALHIFAASEALNLRLNLVQFGRGDVAGQRTAQRLVQMVDAVDVKAHLLHRVVQLGCRQIAALALGDQILHAGAAFALLVRLGRLLALFLGRRLLRLRLVLGVPIRRRRHILQRQFHIIVQRIVRQAQAIQIRHRLPVHILIRSVALILIVVHVYVSLPCFLASVHTKPEYKQSVVF